MSIVKMAKLRLVGLLSDQHKIMDELAKKSCIHIKETGKFKNTCNFDAGENIEALETEFSKAVKAVESLSKISLTNENNVVVKYADFFAQEKESKKMSIVVQSINDLLAKISKNYNLMTKYRKEQFDMIPEDIRKIAERSVVHIDKKSDTEDQKIKNILTKIYRVLLDVKDEETFINDFDITTDTHGELFLSFTLAEADYQSLLDIIEHANDSLKINNSQNGIYEIYFSFKRSMPSLFEEYEKKISELSAKIKECEEENFEIYQLLNGYCNRLNSIKLYADYIGYKLEREKTEALAQKTQSTFILECYIEKRKEAEFISDMEDKFENLVIKKEKIDLDDTPPTKIKANNVVKQADFVVNMYSVPKYNEVDPTISVFFFFMIFFGFIIADMGYGLVLAVVGFMLAKRAQNSGAKRLWNLIAIGGLFAIVWGLLFGSLFGFNHSQWSLIPQGIMPDPQGQPIMLLLICLLMGIFQIAFGYLLRGINYFKHGFISAGFVNGVAWVLFLLGAVMALAKFMLDFFSLSVPNGLYEFLSTIQNTGLIIMIIALAIGVLFAGIGTRGFTKFTKSFSALYGLINLFSDILSYARLFGLMLSSAIIAQQFNQIALGLMTGPAGYIFGFLIILVGHSFNVAMGTLSAYIHDVRLQYVEYFGKFYEGEGVMFKPFTTDLKYITLN